MTVEEIFKSISNRMLDGIMFHSDMVEYYRFLTLDGYSRCHEFRMIAESGEYRKLREEYLHLYDKLLPEDAAISRNAVIPSGWYTHTRQDVDGQTIQNAVRDGLVKWVQHETETKRLYEEMAKELRDMDETDSALFVENLVRDVSKELTKAKKYHLYKEHIKYDLPTIVSEQKCVCEKYQTKIREKYSE